jgi:23S rRNA pseudouridine1911/1915/1917 synthase
MWDTAELMRDTLPDPSNPYLRVANTAGTRNEPTTPDAPRYEGLKPLESMPREIHVLEDLEPEAGIRSFIAEAAAAKMRVDAYLAKALPHISRGRVQMLIENGQVTVNGSIAKASHKLRGGEQIDIEGDPQPAALRAEPEDLPLDIVYEDDDLAVINKAAGMMVHAGAGSLDDNRGTLVNALLFHFGQRLSATAGNRPGIVHRLDKMTSGLIVVAKNDFTHRKLAEGFAERDMRKVYIALVHGNIKADQGTVDLPVSRDLVRRTRMTTRRADGRHAVSHWRVLERIGTPEKPGAHGSFTLLEVRIETGRTHQIRVHMQSLGHPIVGDTLYGAPHHITRTARSSTDESITLDRNFLHAAELDFMHPRTGKPLEFHAPLPAELTNLLEELRV